MRISDWSSDVCSSDLKAARGVAWSRDPDSPFGQCPVPSAQTIWLGSSDGQYLDRLTIAIAPYEIGPYVEGSYKINLPMSAAIVNAAKADYRRDFLPLRSEEHKSALQSLLRISYPVLRLQK